METEKAAAGEAIHKRFVFVLGGARSGKSSWAEELAARLAGETSGGGTGRVVYVATARVEDEEMAERVRHHRARRPSHWRTVEAPIGLAQAVWEAGRAGVVVLIDCLTFYLSNLLLAAQPGEEAAAPDGTPDAARMRAEIQAIAEACRRVPASVVMVSNEVGEGIVPAYPLGRTFRDWAGWANQEMARAADEVYVLFAGIPVEVKSLSARTNRP